MSGHDDSLPIEPYCVGDPNAGLHALVGLLVITTGSSITFAVMNSRARDERESARILASSTGS